MSTILICGDPHGLFSQIIDAVKDRRPDAVILLGDMECKEPLQIELEEILTLTEIWWIHGNHDTDTETSYDNLFGSKLADRNLHGRVVEIAGLKIAGLGGVFRGHVWNPHIYPEPRFENAKKYSAMAGKGNLWRGGLPLKHRSTIFPDDFKQLQTGKILKDGVDILVTHEAPDLHRHGFKEITDLANVLSKPNRRLLKAFHGHHHESIVYEAQERFDGYGVGLREILELDVDSWAVKSIYRESSYLTHKDPADD